MSHCFNVFIKKHKIENLNEKLVEFFKKYDINIELHPNFSLFQSKGAQPVKIKTGSRVLNNTITAEMVSVPHIFATDKESENFESVPENTTDIIQFITYNKFTIDFVMSILFASATVHLFGGVIKDIIDDFSSNSVNLDDFLDKELSYYSDGLSEDLNNGNYYTFCGWPDINSVTCDFANEREQKLIEFAMTTKYISPYEIMTKARIKELFKNFPKTYRSISIMISTCENRKNIQEIEIARRVDGYNIRNLQHAVEITKNEINAGYIQETQFNYIQMLDINHLNTYIDGFNWQEDSDDNTKLLPENEHRMVLHRDSGNNDYIVEQKMVNKNIKNKLLIKKACKKFANKIRNVYYTFPNPIKNSSLIKLYDKGAADAHVILNLENKTGIILPSSYKLFIIEHNAARLQNNAFYYYNVYTKCLEINFITFCDIYKVDAIMKDLSTLNKKDGNFGYFPEELFVFGTNGRGDYVCFDYSNNSNSSPQIVLWQHDTHDNNSRISFVAKSFRDFAKLLFG